MTLDQKYKTKVLKEGMPSIFGKVSPAAASQKNIKKMIRSK